MIIAKAWSAYAQEDPSVLEWHGTLLNGKQDATGTLYRGARYYDPQTGRFTQKDPIDLGGGVNLYGYADGNPVNSADPSGAIPIPVLTGIGGAFVGAAVGGGAYLLTTPRDQWSWSGGLTYVGVGAVAGGTTGATFGAVAPLTALRIPLVARYATIGGARMGLLTTVSGGAAAAGGLLGRSCSIAALNCLLSLTKRARLSRKLETYRLATKNSLRANSEALYPQVPGLSR